MSEDEEELVVEIMPTMKSVVDRFSAFLERGKKMCAVERRAKREDEEKMLDLLQELCSKLDEVEHCLTEVENTQSREKKIERGKKKSNQQKRGRDDEEEDANAVAMVEEEGGHEKRGVRRLNAREENAVEEEVAKKPRAKKLVDGGPCTVDGGGEAVFFVLANEQEDKTTHRHWKQKEKNESRTMHALVMGMLFGSHSSSVSKCRQCMTFGCCCFT